MRLSLLFAFLLVILISLIINNFAKLLLRALFPHDNPLKRIETHRDDDEKSSLVHFGPSTSRR